MTAKKKSKRDRKKRKKKPSFPVPTRSASAWPDNRAIDKYFNALYHLDAGRDRTAATLLRSLIRTSPTFGEAIDVLHTICLEHEWHELLAAGLRDAHRGGNREAQLLGQLVLVSLELTKGEDARQYLDEFQARFPRRRKIGEWRIADLRRDIRALSDHPWEDPTPSSRTPPKPARKPADPIAADLALAEATASRSAPSITSRGARSMSPSSAPSKTSRGASMKPPSSTPSKPSRGAQSKPPPPATSKRSPPARPLLPRPSLGALQITITVEEGNLAERLARGDLADRRRHELCLAAHRLSMVNSIDELLCLPTLRGVRELWYQIETVRKVLRRFRGRALLCDEVGLGKTVEAGMIIKEYLLRGLIRSVLVLVPPSLVAQWREEMSVKFDIAFATTADPLQKRSPAAFWRESRLVIASLSLAKSPRNFLHLTSREFDLIVVDEAHHLKNRNTKAWKLLNSLKSRFLLLLTATPLQNNLEELHNLITLLKPGQLKTRAVFIREFVSKQDPTVPLNEHKLRELLSEVMVRNTRALAGLRLPPRHATTVVVEPAPGERELYDRLSALVRTRYRETDAAVGLNRLTLRLLQSEAGSSPRALQKTLGKIAAARSLEDSLGAELQALSEMAETLESHSKLDALASHLRSSQDKTIVFMSYRETLAFAAQDLRRRGIKVILFHGGMAADEKEAAIDAFRDNESTLLTTEVGGEGRNLQFCHRMVNFDLPWNPMRIEQRIGRIHRIGQEHEVEIVNFCALGSVEDYLLEILDKKINMFELVIGEVDLILGQLEDKREFSERVLSAWASASSQAGAAENFSQLSDELGRAKVRYERIKTLDESLFGEDYEA